MKLSLLTLILLLSLTTMACSKGNTIRGTLYHNTDRIEDVKQMGWGGFLAESQEKVRNSAPLD